MTTFSLALSGADLQISGGRLVLSYAGDAARDRLFTALSTQQGEWYLDADDGVPYAGEGGILGGKKTEAEVGAILRRRILLDAEVDRIVSMQVVESAGRHVAVAAEVLLTSGEPVTVSA